MCFGVFFSVFECVCLSVFECVLCVFLVSLCVFGYVFRVCVYSVPCCFGGGLEPREGLLIARCVLGSACGWH